MGNSIVSAGRKQPELSSTSTFISPDEARFGSALGADALSRSYQVGDAITIDGQTGTVGSVDANGQPITIAYAAERPTVFNEETTSNFSPNASDFEFIDFGALIGNDRNFLGNLNGTLESNRASVFVGINTSPLLNPFEKVAFGGVYDVGAGLSRFGENLFDDFSGTVSSIASGVGDFFGDVYGASKGDILAQTRLGNRGLDAFDSLVGDFSSFGTNFSAGLYAQSGADISDYLAIPTGAGLAGLGAKNFFDVSTPRLSFDNSFGNNLNTANFTFRGDSRGPDIIFAEGFQTLGDSNDLFLHALDNRNPPSNFISTSSSLDVANSFNSDNIYILRPVNGIDVNAVLGSRSPFPHELEIAIPNGVSTNDIRAVTLPDQGVSILNPNYRR